MAGPNNDDSRESFSDSDLDSYRLLCLWVIFDKYLEQSSEHKNLRLLSIVQKEFEEIISLYTMRGNAVKANGSV